MNGIPSVGSKSQIWKHVLSHTRRPSQRRPLGPGGGGRIPRLELGKTFWPIRREFVLSIWLPWSPRTRRQVFSFFSLLLDLCVKIAWILPYLAPLRRPFNIAPRGLLVLAHAVLVCVASLAQFLCATNPPLLRFCHFLAPEFARKEVGKGTEWMTLSLCTSGTYDFKGRFLPGREGMQQAPVVCGFAGSCWSSGADG